MSNLNSNHQLSVELQIKSPVETSFDLPIESTCSVPSIVCCTAIDPPWEWFSTRPPLNKLDWQFIHYIPTGWLEKHFKRLDFTKIRNCWQSVIKAKQTGAALLVSHEAELAFWCGLFSKLLGVQTEHIAYSFNYPFYPNWLRRRLMAYSLKSVSKFVVYSRMERDLYHQYFNIPLERIEFCHWKMAMPEHSPDYPLESDDYICAMGGFGRDYETLMEVMKQLPDIKLVVVARPGNFKDLDVPPNVKVLFNIPFESAMNILKFSRFMVLPLQTSRVPCGHITLVSAMHLSKGIVATNSTGVDDYVMQDCTGLTCEAANVTAMRDAILQLWHDPQRCQEFGENGNIFAQKYCSEESAVDYLKNLLVERELLP